MSGKRQQMRNERTLQELMKTVPGNNTCADCFARNPAWASWSLGIFLCMRCAGLHRKLGTHISKVKSLTMDSWTNDQVEFMKRRGNLASNQIYNPTNTKPNLPLDVDEVDIVMERFVRQKYLDKDLTGAIVQSRPRTQPTSRHDTGSTESDERHSPPLPPLPPKSSRFNFANAISFKSSKSKKVDRVNAWEVGRSPSPPIANNKPSRIFGSSVGVSTSSTELDVKLEKMRDMGFLDEKRNLTVLKGLNGNLERAIETLVRLGEGSKPILPPRPRPAISKETSGISFEKSPTRPQTTSHTHSNNDPFDMPPPPPQPQSSQSTGNMNGSNPYQQAMDLNPFGPVPSQPQHQAFQNFSVSNNAKQSQTLFPHRTGGFPTQHHQHQKFLPSLETSAPAVPQQYPASAVTHYSSIYDFQQPQQQNSLQNQQPQANNNPFLQQTQPMVNGNGNYSANPYLHHASTFPATPQQQPGNPYSQQQQPGNPYSQQQHPGNPYFQQQQAPQQQYQQLQQPQQQQTPQQTYDWTQPGQHQQWANQPPQTQQQNQPQMMYQQQTPSQNEQQPRVQQQYAPQSQYQYQQLQQMMPQQTDRVNKNDIMALYNYPQLAPPLPTQNTLPQNQGESQQQQLHGQFQPNGQPYQQQIGATNRQQQNTASAAASSVNPGSNNPFMTTDGGGGGAGKPSRESIVVEGGGWLNGRHSPDAFASLSTVQTRSMR